MTHSHHSRVARSIPINDGVVVGLLAALMLFAPLFRSGQPPLAVLVLELFALALLVAALWRGSHGLVSAREWLVLSLLLIFPLVYLIPLPAGLAAWLPGRDVYSTSLSLLGLGAMPIRLSVVPIETEYALLVLLVPVAVFLGTRSLDSRHIHRLVLVLLGIAVAQSMLGLMQFGGGKESGFYLGMTFTHFGSAVGTFTNKNHLAGLIEMVLPIALALFLYSLGRGHGEGGRNWRHRVSFFGSMHGHAAFLYGAVALLLLVGLVFTQSRAGIALGMLGILLAIIAFARRIGGDNVYGAAGTVIVVALGLGILIGLAPVLDRFTKIDPMEDLRWPMASATIAGIGTFFPLGSGPGSYAAVFPAFQPTELGRWFVNYAHNDYLQWLFEGGLVAGLLMLLMLAFYLLQWGRVWTRETWSRFRFVQVGAGIGILSMLLHETLDYNLHMPAIMVYFAFLLGIFFKDVDDEAVSVKRRRRHRQTPHLVTDDPASQPVAGTTAGPPADQIPNPFLS